MIVLIGLIAASKSTTQQVAQRAFLNPREVRKTAITTRIMQLVHEVLSKVCEGRHYGGMLGCVYVLCCVYVFVVSWVADVRRLIHDYNDPQGIHITKRDMFYTDVKLFKDQVSNIYLSTVCLALHSPRHEWLIVTQSETQNTHHRKIRTWCWMTWPACSAARAPV